MESRTKTHSNVKIKALIRKEHLPVVMLKELLGGHWSWPVWTLPDYASPLLQSGLVMNVTTFI